VISGPSRIWPELSRPATSAQAADVYAKLALIRRSLPPVTDLRGWPLLHRQHVTQAPEGCDYDFLQARTPGEVRFAEPVIGRS